MSKKRKKDVLTPYESQLMRLGPGEVTISRVQRELKVGFVKAVELVHMLSERGLVKSNIDELNISIRQ